MKKINLIVFFWCLLSVFVGEAVINNSMRSDEIDLLGDLTPDKPKSLIKPIQVFITGQDLEINFNNALGVIAISVYDETGSAVYQQSVNTYAGQQIFIDITSFNEGLYAIEFVDSKGKYLAGKFEI